MKFNFKLQTIISIVVILAGLFTSVYLERDIFYNLSWTFCGLLLIINPIYPPKISNENLENIKKAIRIVGAILIFIGLTNGFGV